MASNADIRIRQDEETIPMPVASTGHEVSTSLTLSLELWLKLKGDAVINKCSLNAVINKRLESSFAGGAA